MFPDDEDILKVKKHIFDPFEYLLHRHKAESAENRISAATGYRGLARPLSSAGSEHRPEDQTGSVTDTGHRDQRH